MEFPCRFGCAVRRCLNASGSEIIKIESGGQLFADPFGKVAHFIKGVNPFLPYPLINLFCPECFLPVTAQKFSQFLRRRIAYVFLFHCVVYLSTKIEIKNESKSSIRQGSGKCRVNKPVQFYNKSLKNLSFGV